MSNIIQITVIDPAYAGIDIWMDVLFIPETINDVDSFLIKAKQDFPGRKVRVIQVLAQ